MEKERIAYIDIAKGLLMLFVISGHINPACDMLNVNSSLFGIFKYCIFTYIPFYMPCFFLITGYCTNFDKTWRTFCSDNARTLLFPIITLQLIVNSITLIFNKTTDFTLIENGLYNINISCWFLMALFIAKNFNWLLLYKKFKLQYRIIMGGAFLF